MVSEIESWPPVYPYGDGAVYNASSWHRGPALTVVLLAMPSPWVISQEFA